MDNFNELVISSSGRKRKIKPETFSRNLTKAARLVVREKLPVIACRLRYHNNKVCQASMSSEEINVMKINRVLYYLS